jgi:hypothetical protein
MMAKPEHVSDKPYFQTVVVIPGGPSEPIESVSDTIDSVRTFLSPSQKIILVDNSSHGLGKRVRERYPDIDVVQGKHNGKFARLYLNIASGSAHAYERYRFEVLLRMDADALIIGARPDEDAVAYFEARSEVGQIGVYKFDYQGRRHSWRPINLSILGQAINPMSWFSPKSPGWNLRRMLLGALKQGYQLGEHIYGGGFFLSYLAVERLYRAGILTNDALADVRLQEDHITSLAVMSVGLKLADFASGNYPMAQAWRGLPDAPEILLQRGKKVIHSVRYYQDLDEHAIRSFFRQQRITHAS